MSSGFNTLPTNSIDSSASSGTTGGIAPPKASADMTNYGNTAAAALAANNLPMSITDDGEYLSVTTASLTHSDPDGNAIWTTLATDVQASSQGFFGLYWDKVDDRLYVLTYNTGNSMSQFAWLDTLTGAVNLLGAEFSSLLFDAAHAFVSVSVTRAAQGTGNFQVSISNTTGLAYLEIPPAGGSTENVISNIRLGGVNPGFSAPFKIDNNLYIGSPRPSTVLGAFSAAAGRAGQGFMICTTDISLNDRIAYDANIGATDTAGEPSPANVNEWGGGIAIWSQVTGYRKAGGGLYDKADFSRWAKEVAVSNGSRVTV